VGNRLRAVHHSDVARASLSVVGVLVALTGVVALIGSSLAFQGEDLLLLIAGIALLAFGVMIVLRWNLRAVKTGLAGMTAGYFASALTEFEVATDPCDIGSTLERCAGHVAGGTPWAVYQGPVVLTVLLFLVIALEPLASPDQPPD
jgi:hypothetical protein